MNIEEIHKSLVNDQRRQMVEQINEYGAYDFWYDYKQYLISLFVEVEAQFNYYTDAVISYNRITNR